MLYLGILVYGQLFVSVPKPEIPTHRSPQTFWYSRDPGCLFLFELSTKTATAAQVLGQSDVPCQARLRRAPAEPGISSEIGASASVFFLNGQLKFEFSDHEGLDRR